MANGLNIVSRKFKQLAGVCVFGMCVLFVVVVIFFRFPGSLFPPSLHFDRFNYLH